MEEMTATNVHDEHYRKVEGRGVEPIEVMETIICNGLPAEFHAIAKRNLNIAQANKYFMRLGEKDSPEKELAKARNYLHRAVHGCWEWQTGKSTGSWALQESPQGLPPGKWKSD